MNIIEFLKLCFPSTDVLIFDKSIGFYVIDTIQTAHYILDNYNLADFKVVGVSIESREEENEDECLVDVPYLEIDIVEV